MKLPIFGSFFAACLSIAVVATGDEAKDLARFRELREKSQKSSLTPAEKAELEAAAKARAAAAEERHAQYAEHQEMSLARRRETGKAAFEAAAARKVPAGPSRAFFVNNESGDDKADGLAAAK